MQGIRLATKPENIALMRLVLRILIVIVLPMLLLAGCGNYSWHQKLTVTIDTPNGVVQASSVMAYKVSDDRHPCLLPEACGVRFELRGEAVVLQVAAGKYLFALLKGVPSLAEQIYPKRDAAESGKLLESGDDAGAGPIPLDPNQYPLLVTFDDINDPASVKRVDPANLEATFGPGYRLNGITLSLTKEPVTRGKVEKLLGWWPHYIDKAGRMISLRYPDKSPRGYDTLSPLDFWSLGNIPT